MKYLKGINTIEELKKQYKKLAMELHPDRPTGNEEQFKILVNKYEQLMDQLQKGNKATTEEKELDKEYKDIINKLMKFDGLIIEVIGTWIWISGNTYPARNIIKKDLNFKWSPNKKMWYKKPEGAATRRGKKNYSIDEIKTMHGVKASIKSEGAKKLA